MDNIEKERMMVLQMVQDGKITAAEAAKLLRALSQTNNSSVDFDMDEKFYEMDEKLGNFSQSVENFAKDCNEKFATVAKDAEPKIKEAIKIVVEKTTAVLDNISKSLNESTKPKEDCCNENCEDTKEDCCEECTEEKSDDDNTPKPN